MLAFKKDMERARLTKNCLGEGSVRNGLSEAAFKIIKGLGSLREKCSL